MARRNDQRVLQKSPEVLRLSRWLETRPGHYVTYSLVSIAPVVAVALTFANCAEEAVKTISAGILVLATSVIASFWVCGKSLLKGIDESLRQQQQKQEQLQKMGVTRVNGKEARTSLHDHSSGEAMLLAARAKVNKMVFFAVAILAKVVCMLLFAMASRYGLETPLLFFVSPMTLVPPIWNIVNVTVHRGRTKLSSSGVASHGQSRVASLSPSYFLSSRSRQRQVVVTETSKAAP